MLDKDEKSVGNLAGHDDLIGKTEYDLENVICCKEWHDYGIRKPIEHRGIFHPSSRHQKGSLKMWLDIIDSKDSKFPVWDISKAPEEEFEVRIAVLIFLKLVRSLILINRHNHFIPVSILL